MFQNFVTTAKDDSAKFLAEYATRCLIVEYRVSYSVRTLQGHPFLMSRKFETQGCPWYGAKWIKSIFADRGILEQGLGHLLITSTSSHFFNKTDLEQYLFNYISLYDYFMV